MSWSLLTTITVAQDWQITPQIAPELGYVRLSFATAGVPVWIAQIDRNSGDIYDERRILATPYAQIFEFVSPSAIVNRALAVRVPNFAQLFEVRIELSNLPIFQGGSGGSGDNNAVLSAIAQSQSAILQQLENLDVESDPAILAGINAIGMGQGQLALRQAQILQRLQEPIIAEVDPAILAGINAIAQSQASHTNAIQQLQSRIEAILTPPPYSLITTPYMATQSSSYGTLTGNYNTLSDGNGITGAATNAGSHEWIKATFPTPQTVRAVQVGGGSLPNWGAVAPYLNGRVIQYSTDDVSWHTVALISGVEDFLPNLLRIVPLGQPISARFWRIWSNSWLSTTEFRFFQ